MLKISFKSGNSLIFINFLNKVKASKGFCFHFGKKPHPFCGDWGVPRKEEWEKSEKNK